VSNSRERPGFKTVEIEVATRCNRSCSYCPVSILESPPDQRWMDDHVFGHTISELAKIGFDGCLSYHFYSEPLLRRDLDRLVSQAKAELPGAYQLLYTNGDLLTDDRYHVLVEAGIDHFIVTQHDNRPFPERRSQIVVMGADLTLTNRGGVMTNVARLQKALSVPCHAPTDMLMVTFNGDILLCCDDAQRRNIMGNIMESPIEDIWSSPRFRRVRKLLAEGKRGAAGGICARCSNMEYVRSGENYYSHLRNEDQL